MQRVDGAYDWQELTVATFKSTFAFGGYQRHVKLCGIDFSRIDVKEFKEALSVLSNDVLVVDFRMKGLYTAAELKEALSGLPGSVTSVDLSDNNFHSKTGVELKQALSGLRKSVRHLDLSDNSLQHTNSLMQALSGLRESVRSLDLSGNEIFRNRTWSQIADSLSLLPQSVDRINLSNNYLSHLSYQSYIYNLWLPNSVTSVNFSVDRLHEPRDYLNLENVLRWLPESVTNVTLSQDEYCHGLETKLKKVLPSLPKNVTTLNLSNHRLYRLNKDQLKEYIASIPGHVKTINVENNSLFIERSFAERDEILNILNPKDHTGKFRFDDVQLKNNGESCFARILQPLIGLLKEDKLNFDLIAYIVSFLMVIPVVENPAGFFKRKLRASVSSEMLSERYQKMGGGVMSRFSFFVKGNEFEDYKERAGEHNQGASEKTLTHFGLNHC